jgi:ABC-type nitrate/sulfonate/bicarbonate transport system ATPase subunit
MPGDAALEVAIAAKRYGALPVLRDIRFAARAGEVLALLGPSGMGKSTTLRIIMGLDRDFTGHVHRPPGRLGVMFQEPRLLPWLSTADNLRLVAEDLPAAHIEALLAEVGLEGTGPKLPRALSLGMARRAALARALAVAPELLVLDEPFASLDARRTAELAAVVARRARDGAAIVVMATHDLAPALAIADRILVLAGRPATLAADIARAEYPDPAALRRALLARFPFLTAPDGAETEAEDQALPPMRR